MLHVCSQSIGECIHSKPTRPQGRERLPDFGFRRSLFASLSFSMGDNFAVISVSPPHFTLFEINRPIGGTRITREIPFNRDKCTPRVSRHLDDVSSITLAVILDTLETLVHLNRTKLVATAFHFHFSLVILLSYI